MTEMILVLREAIDALYLQNSERGDMTQDRKCSSFEGRWFIKDVGFCDMNTSTNSRNGD